MAWHKVVELPAAVIGHMILENTLTDHMRIIWHSQDENVTFLTTKDSFVDMIDDTVAPTDIFDIWSDQENEDLKN